MSVGWPEQSEIDALTALRNRPLIRSKFLDPRPLDPERNREWISHGMKRPYEALLAIRLRPSGALAGAIGWSHGDPHERSFELGRVMIDAAVLQRHRREFPADYVGVAADAGAGLRDFGFRVLGLALMRCVLIDANRLARRAVLFGGGRIVGTSRVQRADGTGVTVTRLEMRRAEWEALVDRRETVPAQAAMATSR